jgi:hypothetical protein
VSELQPTAPRERLLTVDVLRGCALLGVLLGNVYDDYSGRMIRAATDHGRLDDAARFLVEVLVQSKAQTLLCFLFGFGFAVQLVRARERQQPVLPLSSRCRCWWRGCGCGAFASARRSGCGAPSSTGSGRRCACADWRPCVPPQGSSAANARCRSVNSRPA